MYEENENKEDEIQEGEWCLAERALSIPFLEERGLFLPIEILKMMKSGDVTIGVNCFSDVTI